MPARTPVRGTARRGRGRRRTDDAPRDKVDLRWLADPGVYCLDGSVLSRIPAHGPYGKPELLAGLASDREMVGANPIPEYWLDIGRPPDFASAQTDFGAVFAGD